MVLVPHESGKNRLPAVVDLPTPPLPEATAITSLTPLILS